MGKAVTSKVVQTLQGEKTWPPPIWLMRQAGRYLPEYRQVRGEAGSFLQLCNDPQRAAEVTLQPIRRFDLDAAIIFSDILVVPQAMGQDLRFAEGEGPRLGTLPADFALGEAALLARLAPVYEALRLVRRDLAPDKALIGFAGAPWTLAAYMIEGQGGTGFPKAIAAARRGDQRFRALLDSLVLQVSRHLKGQVAAGAEVLQLFDSWAGLLPDELQGPFSASLLEATAAEVKKTYPKVPIIAFPRGATRQTYEQLAKASSIDGLSLGESVDRAWAHHSLQAHKCLQGNLAPETLVQGGQAMAREVAAILEAWGKGPLVFNLGHGIPQTTPPEHVGQLVAHLRQAREPT